MRSGMRLFSHCRYAVAELGRRLSNPYVRNSVNGASSGVTGTRSVTSVESYWNAPQPGLVDRIQVQGPAFASSKNNAYVPALSVFPSSWTSCDTVSVVLSFAPARHGAAFDGP